MIMSEMNLGDAFTRRKALENEIVTWQRRLQLAGCNEIRYDAKDSSAEPTEAIDGTKREFNRSYSIKECLDKIKELIESDKELTIRISKTNQIAKAKMLDLDDNEVELTIPELIVLKNDILPKILETESYIPTAKEGMEVIKKEPNYSILREIHSNVKRTREINKDGFQIEKEETVSYSIRRIEDFGYNQRDVNDRLDKIHAWEQRLKEAINQANKTILINL